jgi:peptide/nickel transport system permease protein
MADIPADLPVGTNLQASAVTQPDLVPTPVGTGLVVGPALPGPGDDFGVAARSRWRMVLLRFLRHRLAIGSLIVFLAVILWSIIGGHLWHYTYRTLTPALNAAPSWAHPFGTDGIGHDVFAQVMHGTETSLEVGLTVALVATVVGALLGALAGYFGGMVDALIMRFTDVVLVIPLLAILVILGFRFAKSSNSFLAISLVIALTSWTYLARIVRASFLSLREREFVEAARAIGASSGRIMLRHLIPNAAGAIIVNATLTIATAILLESALSFLGFGVQPPNTSLGRLISDNEAAAFTEPWLFFFAAGFIVLLVLCINFIGDGLRDALDPSQNRVRA